jgi:flagellar basal-body rod protein FlgC
MFSALDCSASALYANRIWLDTIANNLANQNTVNAGVDSAGRYVPYRRKEVIFQAGGPGSGMKQFGVSVPRIIADDSTFPAEYNPEHPYAVKDPNDPLFGQVRKPNVEPIVEMFNMMVATRAYDFNVTAMTATKDMMLSALRILA